MEIAGLNIVMDADFDQIYSAFGQANTMLQNFANNVKNTFNGIPDFKGKFNFSSNGASQAAQDAREYARAAREQAAADLDIAKASDIAQKAQERKTKATKAEKDEYGQLVAANQLLVREYYNAAASIIKYGDASGITAAQLEDLRKKAKAGQDQLQAIEAGAGRFQRQVGQYGKAFDPLNNSIQQILREMPSAAVSLNTFFLAISNNLPLFFDELTKINAELKGLKEAAVLSNAELAKQTTIQNAAAQAAQAADNTLSAQIDSIVESVAASKEQAIALKEQITGQVKAAGATAESAAAIAANTETLVLNAGANSEDAAALRLQMEANIAATRASADATAALVAQTRATAEATAAAAAQPSLLSRIGKSLFSVNSLLTVGVLALTLYGGELINMVTGSKDAEEALKQQKKAQEELSNAEKQASKEAADHIGKLKTLQFTMTNSELSMRQRTLAYKDAVKLYPAYLDGVSQDKALNGGLADIINDKLIPALIAAGKARAYQNKINILTARSIELEEQQTKNIVERAKAQTRLNIVTQNGKGATQDPEGAGLRGAIRKSTREAKNSLNEITDAQNKNAAERIAINEEIEKSVAKLNENTAKAGDLNPYQKPPKAPKDHAEAIEHAGDRISKAYKDYIDSTKKAGEEIDSLDPYKKTAETLQIEGNAIKGYLDDINSATARQLAAELDLYKDNSKDIQRVLDAKADFLANFANDARKAIADTIAGAADALGEGIGNLIAGSGGVADIFKGIITSIADQVIAFGKYLTQWGATILAAQFAIKALGTNPYLAIAAGVALVAVGSAAKSALSEKGQKVGKGAPFADGGLIYQPTMALMGEYRNARSNPEVVAPLDKLKSIIQSSGGGNQPQILIPTITLKGQDILIALNRAEKSFKR